MIVNKGKSAAKINSSNRPSFMKQIAAYFLSILVLLNISAPAIADVLHNHTIQQNLSKNPIYIKEHAQDYYYRAPAFVEWPSAKSKSLESVYQQLLKEDPTSISEPTYVPIGVGDITTFIPTYTRYKYIGTPAVQARYVRSQIMALLGRNLINGDISSYSSEAKQLNTLFGNAIAYAKNSNRRYGDVLNLDQEASGLDKDMIWPELRTINGKQMIVPIVYLKENTVSERRVVRSEEELPRHTAISELNVVNSDIRLARDSFLALTGNLNLSESSLTSPGALQITADGHFDNVSSIVEANGDLNIGAKSIHNRTIVYRYDLGHEQGARYGEILSLAPEETYGQIANIASEAGSVILHAHEDIKFTGANASANNGTLTLDAGGNIFLGKKSIYTGSKSRYGSGKETRSQLSFLQSHLTAEDTIKLIAGGQIVIDAAEIVSDKGHIELLAGLGVSVFDGRGVEQSQATGKFGKKEVSESTYQTVAIRALLDAGKGIKLETEFGNISLRAADITSVDGTSVNAKRGGVNLLMTTETDHYSYASVKEGTFTTKTVNKGHTSKKGAPNSIVGGFAVEALRGVNVQYTGDPDLSTDEQLDKIANLPGMEWINDVRSSPDVNWLEILDEHEEWRKTSRSLSPAFAAVIAIAVAVVTGGAGAAAAGAIGATGTTATMVAAGTSAFIGQASLAVANGTVNGNIGNALDDFASSETFESLVVAMITAGAMAEVDAAFFNVDNSNIAEAGQAVDSAPTVAEAQSGVNAAVNAANGITGGSALIAQAGQAINQAIVSAGIQAAVYDGVDFDDAFRQALVQSAVDAVGGVAAREIGQAYRDKNINNLTRYIAHAGVGCFVGLGQGYGSDNNEELSCLSGAGGAVVGELSADAYLASKKETIDEINSFIDNEEEYYQRLTESQGMSPSDAIDTMLGQSSYYASELIRIQNNGANIAALTGGLAAFLAGGDVNIASSSAQNAAENNALFLIPLAIFALKAIDIALTAKEIWDIAETYKTEGEAAGNEALNQYLLEQGQGAIIGKFIPGGKTASSLLDFLVENKVVSHKSIDKIKSWFSREEQHSGSDSPISDVDNQAGLNRGHARFDGDPTNHEAKVAKNLAADGNDVIVRGENTPGPDMLLNGKYFDIKELTGDGNSALKGSVLSAKNNFKQSKLDSAGLSNELTPFDARAYIDATGSNVWNNREKVRNEISRMVSSPDLNKIKEIVVLTTEGTVIWKR